MLNKTFRAAVSYSIVLFLGITLFQFAQASDITAGFSDNFDGTTIDPARWIVEENPNMSGNPAYGGNVQIANGSIILSSNGSAFPCVTTAQSPFPASGDFVAAFNFTYTKISDWGNGLWISAGPVISNRTNPSSNIILQIWANNLDYDQSAIFVNLLGKQVYRAIIYGWEPSASTQFFKLQYYGSTYTLFIDGIEVSSGESELRPDTIGFGHPPAYYIPFTPIHVGSVIGGWSSFRIDYITVLPQTSLTVFTSVSSTSLGFNVDVDGVLNTKEGQPLSGKNIVLSYRMPGVNVWNYFTSATTNAQGEYSATWLPSATGSFVIKAEWKGDDVYSGASDAKNISVIRSLDTNLLFVESNSTLSSLSLNTSANEVAFEVSGLAGTNGYVKLFISKTLIADLTEFKVYMDGNETGFTTTSTESLQVLYFEYNHSSHQVTIRLPTVTPQPVLASPPQNPEAIPTVTLVHKTLSDSPSESLTSGDENQLFAQALVFGAVVVIIVIVVSAGAVTKRRKQCPLLLV